jgi:hypothetical protein
VKSLNYSELAPIAYAGAKELVSQFTPVKSAVSTDGNNVGLGQAFSLANQLAVTGSNDTPASFTGTSGTCTVDTQGGGWSCVSDEKLKTNILGIQDGLEAILALNGVTYDWKSNPNGGSVSGFIAQEVQKVLPQLVSELDDGTLSLNRDGMLPYVVEAIKEHNGKIEEVNNQLSIHGLKLENIDERLKTLAESIETISESDKLQEVEIEQLKSENAKQDELIKQLKDRVDQLN